MNKFEKITLKKDDILFKEGDVSKTAYVLTEGLLRVSKTGLSGRRVTIATINKGDIFGEMGLISQNPRTATVTAMKDCELFVVNQDNFNEALDTMNPFMTNIVHNLIDRLSKTTDTAVTLFEKIDLEQKNHKAALDKKAEILGSPTRVNFVIADSNPQTRNGIKSGLFNAGYRNISHVANLTDIGRLLDETIQDVILLDTTPGVPETASFINRIRNGSVGKNPFITIITILSHGDRKAFRELYEAGTDRVIARPFSIESLLDNIREIATRERQFVLTSDYVGPDRIGYRLPGSDPAPKINVPNRIRDKMVRNLTDVELNKELDGALFLLAQGIIERKQIQIKWIINKLDPEHLDKESIPFYLNDLKKHTLDIIAHLEEYGSNEQLKQTEAFLGIIQNLMKHDDLLFEDWIALTKAGELLIQISKAA